jgi:hypothetical protein
MRTGIPQLQRYAHGFRRNQNVGEHNNRVNAQAAKRLQGNLHGQIRRLANFQESMLRPQFPVFGQVTSGLPHHPHGNARCSFATARAKKKFFSVQGRRQRWHGLGQL